VEIIASDHDIVAVARGVLRPDQFLQHRAVQVERLQPALGLMARAQLVLEDLLRNDGLDVVAHLARTKSNLDRPDGAADAAVDGGGWGMQHDGSLTHEERR
jgi:hypothetical protein